MGYLQITNLLDTSLMGGRYHPIKLTVPFSMGVDIVEDDATVLPTNKSNDAYY